MDFSHSSQQQPTPPQQQFQQDSASSQAAVYDPSQIQSYYYPTYYPNYYQNYQNPPQIHDYSSYYNTQFVNGYDHQQHQQQYSQPESAGPEILPPGVSARPDVPPQPAKAGGGSAMGATPAIASGQQNGYYQVPGLNPAAAAAVLAQITQIAGNLGGFQGPQRPVIGRPGLVSGPGSVGGPEPNFYGPRPPRYPLGGRSQYRGGGRRSGGSFRGRGRVNIGNRPLRKGGSSHKTGCVQGMRGSGNLERQGTSPSHSEPSAAAEVQSEEQVAEPLAATNEEKAECDVQPQKPVIACRSEVKSQQPTRGAHCELCKVDCNSLEILEQHKNGKRHKKKLQRLQLLENTTKPEKYKEKIPGSDPNPEMASKPEITEDEENKSSLPENLHTEVGGDDNKMDTQQTQHSNDKEETPHISGNAQSDCLVSRPSNQKRGLKRKMKGGRGGKRVRTVGAPRGSLKTQKPKIVVPFICDLCNVRCDTKEVFDHHLSGKKHISKLKRFEAHQAMYGPVGLQALYPPSSIAQNLFHQQCPQAFYSPQGSYPSLGTDMPAAIPAVTGTVSRLEHNPNPQLSNETHQSGHSSAFSDTQQQAALAQPKLKQGA